MPGLVTMKPNTAVGFLLSGVSLWFLIAAPKPKASRLCATAVVLLGTLTLSQNLFEYDLGLDQLLFEDNSFEIQTSSPGRMSLGTAVNFVFMGSGLLLLSMRSRKGRRLADIPLLITSLISILALVGYIYGVQSLYRIASFSSMALHTAVGFLAIATGALLSRPEGGIGALAASRGLGGVQFRQLIPAAVCVPFLVGLLRLLGEQAGLYDSSFGVALFASLNVVIFSFLLWLNSRGLDRTDAALRESEERLNLALKSSRVGTWNWDIAENVVLWDDYLHPLFGLKPGTFPGRYEDFAALLHPDDRDRVAREVTAAVEKDEPYDTEYRVVWPDSTVRWLASRGKVYRDKDGRALRMTGVCWDITEVKQSTEIHQRLAAIVESTEDAIIGKTLDGIITSWNSGAERVYGYTAAEIIGKPVSLLVLPDHPDEVQGILHRIRQGQSVAHFETVRVRKDGTRINVALTISPIRDATGKVMGASTVARDITESKQAQEKIRALNAELEQRVLERTAQLASANQELQAANNELEAFTYSVSHDLRAPLRHIDGFSKILLEEYNATLPPDAQRYLARVRQGTQQMGRLVDDLLNLGRVGRQEVCRQVTGLNSIVEEVRSELERETEGRVVEWQIGPLPFVECDPALIKQAIANLLSNALKYSRPRSTARIEVGQIQQDGRPVVFVRDNGVGFNMKYAQKLFGVFQRLHRAEDFEGTGVGLATVSRIIHKHGGKVWAEAELDKGATFFFSLGAQEETFDPPPLMEAKA